MMFNYSTANDAWEGLMVELIKQAEGGFKQPSRAGDVVGEFYNTLIVIEDPTRGFVDSPFRKLDVRYAVGELMWYLSGSNMLSAITPFSKFWGKISDDGDTLNSAYGHRIKHRFGFDQWEYVKGLLQADPYTRQAVIHIKEASNEPSKDVPCTLSLQFQIRDGELHLAVVMRSNDIWLGFPFDVFCFTAMQMKMSMELGVAIGEYSHFIGSLHLYEKDVEKFGAVKNTDKNSQG
jgi:thymidylate synthase